jgi:tRNA (adenine22-N1)-methyltransferase
MISIRLETIGKMVNKGVVAADIGTDHAFLPIWLIQNGIAGKVYACDINEGPLKTADANIREAGFQDRIVTVLADGLNGVPDDVDCIIIAGMGYYTAEHILEEAMERLPGMKQIIVEVNRDERLFRQWLSAHKFRITDEKLITDRRHDYAAIAFRAEEDRELCEEEILTGTEFMKKDRDIYEPYCRRNIRKIEKILQVCRRDDPRIPQLQKDLQMWKDQLQIQN